MNKLILVTGGTKGIGRAIIEKFALEDFDVLTCARSDTDLFDLKTDMEDKFPRISVYTCQSDISKVTGIRKLAELFYNLNRDIDVLVNNAGIFIPGEISTEDDGILEKMIETNLYSGYRITRAVVGGMIKKKYGHIFNICSTASIEPYENGGSYTISKHAQYGMSKMFREELKKFNIRVTSVIPGSTLTSSWEGSGIPADNFVKPEDVAISIFNAWEISSNSVVEELIIRPLKGNV